MKYITYHLYSKSHCFEKSQHVNHLKHHPLEYKKLVFDFIDGSNI